MPPSQALRPVLQMRVAVTTADFERLLKFYSEGLGIQPSAFWQNDGGRAAMMELGQASLEVFDQAQARAIDVIEVGQPSSGHVRLALQVPDLDAAVKRLTAHGAQLVHGPVETPWGDRNARFQDPDGLQITLFQSPPKASAAS